jgi:hypothetical protein
VTSTERPTPRSRPRPAADETVDPVVSQPTQTAPSSELPAAVRRGPEPTVQLNVRVAADVSSLIDEAVRTTGRTKRQLIEHAIRQTYRT